MRGPPPPWHPRGACPPRTPSGTIRTGVRRAASINPPLSFRNADLFQDRFHEAPVRQAGLEQVDPDETGEQKPVLVDVQPEEPPCQHTCPRDDPDPYFHVHRILPLRSRSPQFTGAIPNGGIPISSCTLRSVLAHGARGEPASHHKSTEDAIPA